MSSQSSEFKSTINISGRILIPLTIRQALGVDIGDEVLIRLQERELRIIPLAKAVEEAQNIIQQYNSESLNLSEILSDLRMKDTDSE